MSHFFLHTQNAYAHIHIQKPQSYVEKKQTRHETGLCESIFLTTSVYDVEDLFFSSLKWYMGVWFMIYWIRYSAGELSLRSVLVRPINCNSCGVHGKSIYWKVPLPVETLLILMLSVSCKSWWSTLNIHQCFSFNLLCFSFLCNFFSEKYVGSGNCRNVCKFGRGLALKHSKKKIYACFAFCLLRIHAEQRQRK